MARIQMRNNRETRKPKQPKKPPLASATVAAVGEATSMRGVFEAGQIVKKKRRA